MFRPRKLVPPPEKATWADAFRVGLGGLMLVLGIIILWRTVSLGIINPASILMSAAFIGFGAYRLYVGWVRYRMYRDVKRKT